MSAPSNHTTIEGAIGGLPVVKQMGLNTNKAANLSGLQVDTSGNLTTSGSIAATGGITNLGGAVTGPTGSFGVLQVTSAQITGPTGASATIGLVGAADGGPTTAAQAGWMKVTVNGTQYWTPIWA